MSAQRLSKNAHRAKALRLDRAMRSRGREMARTLDLQPIATAIDAFRERLQEVVGSEVSAGATSPRNGAGYAASLQAAAPAVQPSARPQRDPRLGHFVSIGAFKSRVNHELDMYTPEIFQIARLERTAPDAALLDYPGGLDSLYIACGLAVRSRQRQEATA